jgi:hypothetical protein
LPQIFVDFRGYGGWRKARMQRMQRMGWDGMGDAEVGVVESGRTCGWLVLWVYGWIRVPESVELSP